MHLSRLLVIVLCATLPLSACWGKKPKVQQQPEPARVVMEIQAASDINPNAEGRPSPLVLRVYELKSMSHFLKADFLSLYEKDENALGRELVRKEEITINPNEKHTVYFEPKEDTSAVGVFAALRQYDQGRWRVAADVLPNKFLLMHIWVGGTSIKIQ